MGRKHTRFIGAAAALLAAGLAGFSLRSQQRSATSVAARNPATDVRTQVIRRTVHIIAPRALPPRGGTVRGFLPRGNARRFTIAEPGAHRRKRLAWRRRGRIRRRSRGGRSDPHEPVARRVQRPGTRRTCDHANERVARRIGFDCRLRLVQRPGHDPHQLARAGGSTSGSVHVTTRSSGGHGGEGSDSGDGGDHGGD